MSELDVFGFPVQIGKVQPPFLPAETLERQRLLDWLAAKIHSRLILIVADAGHGKTTLLADWTRRTRVRTLWYRLDDADRDWVVFVNHVVAAGREIDPGFAPHTMALIRELAAGMGDRSAIVRTLLAEMRAWVTGGTALVLDDYQVVDDVAGGARDRSGARSSAGRSASRSWCPRGGPPPCRSHASARSGRSPSSPPPICASTATRWSACSGRPTGTRSSLTSWTTSLERPKAGPPRFASSRPPSAAALGTRSGR